MITDEEQSFVRTLDDGVKHFKKVVAAMQSSGSTVVPAKDAHILFSSMGFPLDLVSKSLIILSNNKWIFIVPTSLIFGNICCSLIICCCFFGCKTELMAAERGLTVDTEGFKALMEQDRLISKADTQVGHPIVSMLTWTDGRCAG